LYGQSDNAIEELEYINAAHVFSDILGMAGDTTKREVCPQYRLNKIFVVNVIRGEICVFWTVIPAGYTSAIAQDGRPPKSMRVTLYHGRKYLLFEETGLRGFISEFSRLCARVVDMK
jgi:hypothetical protein